MNQPGKAIFINGKKLSYTRYGKGEPVLLVHGFAEDSSIWQFQLDALAEKHLVIVPDLPGSGQSAPATPLSMDSIAEAMRELLDAEQIHQVVMIGHSMGGYITLAFAEKYPERLKGFGLFHSTAYADSDEKKEARRKGIAFIRTHGSHEFLKQSIPNLFSEAWRIEHAARVTGMIAQYRDFDPLALIACYEAMIQRPERTGVLASFKQPVLFVIGKQDKSVPFEDSMQQCRLPQLSHIHVLENSAHMGMWEETEKSNKALASFLDDVYVK